MNLSTSWRSYGLCMRPLDHCLPDYQVSEVHSVALRVPPERALERVLALPAGSDRTVRSLFRLRGLRGAHLPLERFMSDAVGLRRVERTATQFVAAGRVHGIHIGVSFDAEAQPNGGCRLVTETRVAGGGTRFRLYWLVVGPFSALIRRRWLRAVARMDEQTDSLESSSPEEGVRSR